MCTDCSQLYESLILNDYYACVYIQCGDTVQCIIVCICLNNLRDSYIVHFWGAEGAPILFSELGIRMASCSYI